MKKRTQRYLSIILALMFSLSALPCLAAFAYEEAAQEASAEEESVGEEVGKFAEGLSFAGYRYRADGNYFYVDQDKAWQGKYGYMRAYDLIAPYVLLEYDYVRVHFTYEGKDWMIQLWKGQYGLAFYGAETGVYYKDASDSEDTAATVYSHVKDDDMPWMQTALYHDPDLVGDYSEEFVTPYEQTWWSTGFKAGHLTREEPASELRQCGLITFKNEELANLFAEGLKSCGFTQAENGSVGIDSFSLSGPTVSYVWQDISDAENTMPIKIAVGTMLFLHFAAVMTAILVIVGGFMGMGLLLLLI
ncbi:MAG: DUF4474 domain-containing protein [Clostridia bacterium]|nr:DUF4474 domain-containing protein [Clostridia bacterium]